MARNEKELFVMGKIRYDTGRKAYTFHKPVIGRTDEFKGDSKLYGTPDVKRGYDTRSMLSFLRNIKSNYDRGEIYGYRIILDTSLSNGGIKEFSDANSPKLETLIIAFQTKYDLEHHEKKENRLRQGVKTA